MAMETAEASPVLNHLQAQHRSYEAMLQSLAQRPYLTEEEKLEEVRLKKLKLHVKDEMEALRAIHSA
ncbi:MAG TPA: YdcH family protein [Acidisarcina sp.]